MQQKVLYATILGGLLCLFTASLGSGIWNRPADYTSWQYVAFRGVCHQVPERSFHIHEVPMAVNARCFGVFTGLLSAWLLVPVLAGRLKGKQWPGILLAVAVLIQVLDFTAGQFSIWNSTNFSRFFLGGLLGAAVVCMLADQFKDPSGWREC